MSDLEARKLERILKRNGTLHDFVLIALEGFDREDLGLVLVKVEHLLRPGIQGMTHSCPGEGAPEQQRNDRDQGEGDPARATGRHRVAAA